MSSSAIELQLPLRQPEQLHCVRTLSAAGGSTGCAQERFTAKPGLWMGDEDRAEDRGPLAMRLLLATGLA